MRILFAGQGCQPSRNYADSMGLDFKSLSTAFRDGWRSHSPDSDLHSIYWSDQQAEIRLALESQSALPVYCFGANPNRAGELADLKKSQPIVLFWVDTEIDITSFAAQLVKILQQRPVGASSYLFLPTPRPVSGHRELASSYWPPGVDSAYKNLPKLFDFFRQGLQHSQPVNSSNVLGELRKCLETRPLQLWYQTVTPLLGTDSLVARLAAVDPQLAQQAQQNLAAELNRLDRHFKTQPLLGDAISSSRIPGGATGEGLGAVLYACGAHLVPFPQWWLDHNRGNYDLASSVWVPDLVVTNQPTLFSWDLPSSPLAVLAQVLATFDIPLIGYSYQLGCSSAELRDWQISGWYKVKEKGIDPYQAWYQAGQRGARTWSQTGVSVLLEAENEVGC